MVEMTSDQDGVTESGKEFPAGTKVEYLGHVVGGMVKVRVVTDDSVTTEIVHPGCFKELR